MRTMISDILAQAGFEVVGEAETGSQAVDKYKQLKPDLVTMDIVMPDMGGIFRAVHTGEGMAATMGYARVAEVAHRMENLLDHLRRGRRRVGDDVLQLLFRSADVLEKAINLSVVGREREANVADIAAELDAAAPR